MTKTGKLFIVSAPSGAGKTTLVNAILSKLASSHRLEKVITYTTKQPRPGEIPGIDYLYVSTQAFELKVKEGFFLETTNALGHYYGTPGDIRDKIAQGISPILIIDREGARQIVEQVQNTVLIWIQVKSLEMLEKRLLLRAADTAEQIERRLKRASHEMEEEKRHAFYKHHITNNNVSDAIRDFESIILAELNNDQVESFKNTANVSI